MAVSLPQVVIGSPIVVGAQSMPIPSFLSRPDIISPEFRVTFLDIKLAYNGLIFVASDRLAGSNATPAMYTYNLKGSLVWSGHAFSQPDHIITNFHVCSYQGLPHLCTVMYQGRIGGGTAADAFGLIIDRYYRQIQAIAPSAEYHGATLTQDLHEFQLVGAEGATALLSSFATIRHPTTLTACPHSPTAEYVTTGLFTETSTDGLNRTIFQWSALDHVSVHESFVCPGDSAIVGSGASSLDGFNYFHINAIDRDENGDYLVSARHTSTVYKIAGLHSPSGQLPGSIIWKLGGKANSFVHMNTTVPNSGHFNFSSQHHARFRSGGISLWNNGYDRNLRPSAVASSAMDIDINEDTKTATLVYQAVPPSKALSPEKGSHQILPNDNHFCETGSTGEVFERTLSGALALEAHLGLPFGSYRALKSVWTGWPDASELALFVYARSCGANMAYYVSWNGATEVAAYRFFTSNSSFKASSYAVTVPKGSRFETVHESAPFGLYTYAEAIDVTGAVLGTTPRVATFVPDVNLAWRCNELRCRSKVDYRVALRATCIV